MASRIHSNGNSRTRRFAQIDMDTQTTRAYEMARLAGYNALKTQANTPSAYAYYAELRQKPNIKKPLTFPITYVTIR